MPDAQILAGVNVTQVMATPLALAASRITDAKTQKQLEAAGFDFRRDLREILVAQGKPPQSVIFLARGTFDLPKVIETAQGSGDMLETYKGVSVLRQKQGEAMAFPDSTLAIAGHIDVVRAAIDRISAPTAISSALAVEVNNLSTTEDAWFVATGPFPQFQLPNQANASPSAPSPLGALEKVQQISGGVKFGANLQINLQAVSPTAQDSTMLATQVRGLTALSDIFIKDEYLALRTLLQSLSVTADGTLTKLSLTIPESQIEQMIKASRADQEHARQAAQAKPESAPRAADTGTQRIRVGSAVQKWKLIQQIQPVYPPLALQARISGVVRLNAIIGVDGTVKELSVVSGHPLLVPAALEAAKQWLYQPTLLNGRPVEVVTQLEVNFSLEP